MTQTAGMDRSGEDARADGMADGEVRRGERRPHLGHLEKDERKSLTHGDFWIPDEERELYKRALRALNEGGVPYVVAGAYAIYEHTGIYRETKDLDVFVEPRHLVAAMEVLKRCGFRARLEQPHWLAKATWNGHFVDVIYGMGNGLSLVDADWYRYSSPAILAATPVRVAPVEELIWGRLFVSERHRHDMADNVHLMLCIGAQLDWERLLAKTGEHWPLLLAQLHVFHYVYPEAKGGVPRWVMGELLDRARRELDRGRSGEHVTRGPLLSRFSFAIDVNEWRFRNVRAETTRAIEQRPEVREIAMSDVWDELSPIAEEYRARAP
jgi:hypothetical protein